MLAAKSMQAITTIDKRLKKQIANSIRLKTRLALAKCGIDLRILPTDDDLESVFEELENNLVVQPDLDDYERV